MGTTNQMIIRNPIKVLEVAFGVGAEEKQLNKIKRMRILTTKQMVKRTPPKALEVAFGVGAEVEMRMIILQVVVNLIVNLKMIVILIVKMNLLVIVNIPSVVLTLTNNTFSFF